MIFTILIVLKGSEMLKVTTIMCVIFQLYYSKKDSCLKHFKRFVVAPVVSNERCMYKGPKGINAQFFKICNIESLVLMVIFFSKFFMNFLSAIFKHIIISYLKLLNIKKTLRYDVRKSRSWLETDTKMCPG